MSISARHTSSATRQIKKSSLDEGGTPATTGSVVKYCLDEEQIQASHSIVGNTISISTSSLDSSSKNEALPLLYKLATTARMHGKRQELEEAWECCATIKQILQRHAESLPMKKLLAETYYRMALIYETHEDFEEAMSNYLESWRLFKYCKEQDAQAQLENSAIQSHVWMIKCLVQISELLVTMEYLDDALDVADRAIKEIVKIPKGNHEEELLVIKDKVFSNFNTILKNSNSTIFHC